MIDPDMAAVIVYFQQLIVIVACALILVGVVAVLGLFFTATVLKRLRRLELATLNLTKFPDTHTHTHTQTPPKMDGLTPAKDDSDQIYTPDPA